jgi:hypothetical protein
VRDDYSAAPQVVQQSAPVVQPDDLAQDERVRQSAPVVQPDDLALDEPAQKERVDALVVPASAAERDDSAEPQQARRDARSQQVEPGGLPAD